MLANKNPLEMRMKENPSDRQDLADKPLTTPWRLNFYLQAKLVKFNKFFYYLKYIPSIAFRLKDKSLCQ